MTLDDYCENWAVLVRFSSVVAARYLLDDGPDAHSV